MADAARTTVIVAMVIAVCCGVILVLFNGVVR